jgi:hypothetical protein
MAPLGFQRAISLLQGVNFWTGGPWLIDVWASKDYQKDWSEF